MAVDDLKSLGYELQDLLEGRPVPTRLEDDWVFAPLDQPETPRNERAVTLVTSSGHPPAARPPRTRGRCR